MPLSPLGLVVGVVDLLMLSAGCPVPPAAAVLAGVVGAAGCLRCRVPSPNLSGTIPTVADFAARSLTPAMAVLGGFGKQGQFLPLLPPSAPAPAFVFFVKLYRSPVAHFMFA